jgi:hypothetical protein
MQKSAKVTYSSAHMIEKNEHKASATLVERAKNRLIIGQQDRLDGLEMCVHGF